MSGDFLHTKKWISGSGNETPFKEVRQIIKEKNTKGYNIFIGSDSFISGGRVCFATAVCLHSSGQGSRYFFYKEKKPAKMFSQLSARILEEARRSVELAEYFITKSTCVASDIELHLDVSPFHKNEKTSKFSEMLKGYVQGYGFECKLKPNAWASQSVADKHSK